MNSSVFIRKRPMLEETFLLDQLCRLQSNEVGLAVLGYPIKHSISPQIHTAALEALALGDPAFACWNYRKIEVLPEHLSTALPRLVELGFRGLNLTIPHKVEVLPLLSDIDPQAEIMGAVNTLKWENNGWHGYNTDGYGLSLAIRNAFQKSLSDFHILVLGSGGAARAAVAQCLFEGCSRLAIYNRSPARAHALSQTFLQNKNHLSITVVDSPCDPFGNNEHPLLVINATSLGLRADDPSPIDLSVFAGHPYVYDMVYNPPETRLLAHAKDLGCPHVNGLGMLVGQAARSLEIWTGREVSFDAMNQAALEALVN
jgi:shikimate dehydrogenase